MALALPTDSLDLPPSAPPYVHHVEPYAGARYLVICIAGLHTDVTKPRTAWPYRPRLARLAAHRVFLDPAPPRPGDRWVDTPLLSDFLDAAREALDIPAERTIVCGSSLGATAGIIAATRAGIGHVMAGSPVASLGDYVSDPDAPEAVRLSMGGQTLSPERRAFANTFVPQMLREHATPMRLDLLFGEADHLFPADYDAIVAACEANPAIDLHATTVPGIHHMNVYRPWARHMAEILKSIAGTAPE